MDRRARSLRAAATLAAFATLSLPIALVDPSLANKPATAPASKVPAQVIHQGFQSPVGMAFGPDGSLYVANWGGCTVERIDASGRRSVFAGDLASPSGLAIDKDGNVYVALFNASQIVRIDASGLRSVFASGLGTPVGIAFDAAGSLVIANRGSGEIVAITPNGTKEVLARGLPTPTGVAPEPDGGYVIANYDAGISRLARDGTVTQITHDFARPAAGIAVNKSGRVFAVDYGGAAIREVLREGRSIVIAEGITSPVGLVLDQDGTLLVGAWGDGNVWRIAP
jgi:DNA-binding beta-propeller fold protein YncE